VTPASRPRWPAAVGLTLCGLGFAVAGYLTYEHYTSSTSLSCPAGGGAVNCLKVTTSIYSKIHGVPVALLGLVFFTVMAVLQTPQAWRTDRLVVRAARVLWSTVGVATALWLIYAELFKIDAICLWCTSVHILTVLLFISTAFGTVAIAPEPDLEIEDSATDRPNIEAFDAVVPKQRRAADRISDPVERP
jgi:uncharacterized membrane protein